jgi:hypothetical protein
MTRDKLRAAIKFATSNEQALKESAYAGCYYCLRIYPSSEVTQFLEVERTALCPKCGIDSVLPSNSPYELTVDTLKELNKFWF